MENLLNHLPDVVSHAGEWVEWLGMAIGAAAVINKTVAALWRQTPGTPDTEVYKKIGKALKQAQKVLGVVGFDTSKIERKRDRKS